ncbi:hypothetical protein N7539_003543, partial [Penicillium diatomitis]
SRKYIVSFTHSLEPRSIGRDASPLESNPIQRDTSAASQDSEPAQEMRYIPRAGVQCLYETFLRLWNSDASARCRESGCSPHWLWSCTADTPISRKAGPIQGLSHACLCRLSASIRGAVLGQSRLGGPGTVCPLPKIPEYQDRPISDASLLREMHEHFPHWDWSPAFEAWWWAARINSGYDLLPLLLVAELLAAHQDDLIELVHQNVSGLNITFERERRWSRVEGDLIIPSWMSVRAYGMTCLRGTYTQTVDARFQSISNVHDFNASRQREIG